MHRDEAIVQLRMIVDEGRNMRAQELANELHTLTGLYPHGWQPHKDGIRWLGFYIREGYFDVFEPEIAASVQQTFTYHEHWWSAATTETRSLDKKIKSAKDLLDLLENHQPYVH